MNLRGHTDEALLSDVRRLIGSQRELTARLVVHLAEIEHRRLHLLAGFSSMFDFCVKELHMSEGEAFRRLAAARLGRKYPVIHSLIASGEVHLSCRAHNRLWAEQTFGRAHIEGAVNLRQQKYGVATSAELPGNEVSSASLTKRRADSTYEKVILALAQLGFREAQARRAVCIVEKREGVEGLRTVETLLRESLLEATRAA